MGNRFLLCGQKGGIAVRLCLYAEPIRGGFVLRTAIRQLFQDDRQMGFKEAFSTSKENASVPYRLCVPSAVISVRDSVN